MLEFIVDGIITIYIKFLVKLWNFIKTIFIISQRFCLLEKGKHQRNHSLLFHQHHECVPGSDYDNQILGNPLGRQEH